MTRLVPLALLLSCLLPADGSAAVRFKRFHHCDDGLVTVKTCECHKSNSRIWHYCHKGDSCDTSHGTCHKS